MADVTVAFDPNPVAQGEQTAFTQATVGIGDTTIELDLSGKVRLAAIAFEAGFEGASIVVSAVVPWTGGDANQEVLDLPIAITAGKVVKVAFSDAFYLSKILLTINAAQTAPHVIGFFGWRGRVE
jgi:hypothetical protein